MLKSICKVVDEEESGSAVKGTMTIMGLVGAAIVNYDRDVVAHSRIPSLFFRSGVRCPNNPSEWDLQAPETLALREP